MDSSKKYQAPKTPTVEPSVPVELTTEAVKPTPKTPVPEDSRGSTTREYAEATNPSRLRDIDAEYTEAIEPDEDELAPPLSPDAPLENVPRSLGAPDQRTDASRSLYGRENSLTSVIEADLAGLAVTVRTKAGEMIPILLPLFEKWLRAGLASYAGISFSGQDQDVPLPKHIRDVIDAIAAAKPFKAKVDADARYQRVIEQTKRSEAVAAKKAAEEL